MDTRLTKSRSNRIFKAIIILLSLVFFFFGAFYLQKLEYYFSVNAPDYTSILNLNTSKSVLGNGNTNYANEIRKDIDRISKLATLYKNDASVEDGSAFAPTEKRMRDSAESEIAEQILQDKKDVIEGMYTYNDKEECYEYPFAPIDQNLILKNFTSEDQIRADNSKSGVTTVNGLDYYKGYPLNKVSVEEDAIRYDKTAFLESQIISSRTEFKVDYENIKSHLSKLKNLTYYFENIETGEVYTNMNVTSVNEASQNMTGYSACIVNGDLKVSEEIQNIINSDDYYAKFINYEQYSDSSIYGGYIETRENAEYYYAVFGDASTFKPKQINAYIHVNTNAETIIKGDEYSDLYDNYTKTTSSLKGDVTFFAIMLVLWILSIVLLVSIAGTKGEDGEVILAPVDKIPNSIHFIISAAASIGLLVWATCVFYDFIESAPTLPERALVSLIAVVACALFIEWIMSTSRQVKRKLYFKNTLTYRFLVKNFRKLATWWKEENDRIVNKSIRRGIFFPLSIYTISTIIFAFFAGITINDTPGLGILFICIIVLTTITIIAYLMRITAGLDSMDAALTDAEQGKFNYKIDAEIMPVAIKPLAEKTNNLTDGIKVAVDEAVKGNRLKTELITNVSHDLKTPLTSIITYSGLLKMCDIKDEKALEYIDVLDEKSQRLKRLIEDLVEASKVTSGNVKLVMSEINVGELVEQIFGEYENDLSESGLDLKCSVPDEPIIVTADGQKTYRIIDNLFSNVKKYAMPGTRVYLDIFGEPGFAVISMKNVAKDEMNFDVSKLTERFIRGDESRTTEGSGLGLSIAESLTQLQGGVFDISLDGDLFKVVIKLPRKSEPPLLKN